MSEMNEMGRMYAATSLCRLRGQLGEWETPWTTGLDVGCYRYSRTVQVSLNKREAPQAQVPVGL